MAPLTNIVILWAVTLAFCGGIVAVATGLYTLLPAPYWLCRRTSGEFHYEDDGDLFSCTFASVYTENPGIVIWLVYIYLLLVAILIWRLSLRQLLYPACLSAVSCA